VGVNPCDRRGRSFPNLAWDYPLFLKTTQIRSRRKGGILKAGMQYIVRGSRCQGEISAPMPSARHKATALYSVPIEVVAWAISTQRRRVGRARLSCWSRPPTIRQSTMVLEIEQPFASKSPPLGFSCGRATHLCEEFGDFKARPDTQACVPTATFPRTA
jgi:hypothetical protein